MSTLLPFLQKHRACPEGMQLAYQLIKKGFDTPEEVWTYRELPHHYRLWMFSKMIDSVEFKDFVHEVVKPYAGLLSGRSLELFQSLEKRAVGDSYRTLSTPDCTWLCNEVTRLAWVQQFNTAETHPEYLKVCQETRDEKERMSAKIRLCAEALDAAILKQVTKMIELEPRVME